MYYFTFFIGERGTTEFKGAWAYLKINSVNIMDAAVDAFHNYQDLQGGNAVVVRLNLGDTVWISGFNGAHIEGSSLDRITSFTGMFLYA